MITGTILIIASGIIIGGAVQDTWPAYVKAIVGLFCAVAGTFMVVAQP